MSLDTGLWRTGGGVDRRPGEHPAPEREQNPREQASTHTLQQRERLWLRHLSECRSPAPHRQKKRSCPKENQFYKGLG